MSMNYSDFMELAGGRYSIRSFDSRPLEREVIDKILEAGRVAPTACNRQPQRILVVNDEKALEKLRKSTECHFNAPAALIVCHDKNECWKRSYDGKSSGDIDAAIVTTHLMLAAQSLGVGTTWVMYFDPEALRAEFDIPEDLEPTAILPMGWPAADAKPAPQHGSRKPLDETVGDCVE